MSIIILVAALLTGGPSVDRAAICAAHHSETVPPRTIRVRLNSGHVIRVGFAAYTANVVSNEWNKVPLQLRLAGAVAVRQYAWYKTLHPRPSRHGCFDVWANTNDQIFRPHKTPPAYIWQAVRDTWSWRVLRDGRLVQTGYRTGRPHRCAADVDGYHLFARSAARCANLGWSARRILATYYGGTVRV